MGEAVSFRVKAITFARGWKKQEDSCWKLKYEWGNRFAYHGNYLAKPFTNRLSHIITTQSVDAYDKTYLGPLGDDDTTYRPFTAFFNQLESAQGNIEKAHHLSGPYEDWPLHKKRKVLSDSMLTLRNCFPNMLIAAEAFDTERSNEKQADNEAALEKDFDKKNSKHNNRKKKKKSNNNIRNPPKQNTTTAAIVAGIKKHASHLHPHQPHHNYHIADTTNCRHPFNLSHYAFQPSRYNKPPQNPPSYFDFIFIFYYFLAFWDIRPLPVDLFRSEDTAGFERDGRLDGDRYFTAPCQLAEKTLN